MILINIVGWFSTIFSSKEHYVKRKIFAKEDGCLLVHLRD
jgi:FixJ family two-component response regulator